MSVLPVAKRSMRILALPLVAASRTPETTSSIHLTYYHFSTPPPHADKGNSWSTWVTDKAVGLWAGFGKAPEGTWKRKTFVYGERLVDRMDFEELALKSLDPSLGPSITRFGHSETDIKPEDNLTIPLIYPDAVCSSPVLHLRTLLSKRTPRHKRGFYMWMLISPLTAPFMIIPIIPNLPFFFCVWRSWSHFRAYKASSYLEQLLEKGAIVPRPSVELNEIYIKYAPPSTYSTTPSKQPEDIDSDASSTTMPSGQSSAEPEQQLLLTRDAVPAITARYDTRPNSSLAAEMYRAMEQAILRLQGSRPDGSSDRGRT